MKGWLCYDLDGSKTSLVMLFDLCKRQFIYLGNFFRLVGWEFDLCCWHGLQHNLLVLALFSWLWLVTGADLLWEKNTVGGWCWFVVKEKHHCWLPTEVDLNLKCNQCWKFKPDIFHMRSIQWLSVFASMMFSFPVDTGEWVDLTQRTALLKTLSQDVLGCSLLEVKAGTLF